VLDEVSPPPDQLVHLGSVDQVDAIAAERLGILAKKLLDQ
jgi:hypothetical protein